ncbi:DNA phosphorothioation-dependent restriction protein DptF [Brevibacillus dissolubilis]|uniref:DNA phosphorothioation-dependent restriction protein DptF n=1 Tax=Brevibacillus dissolubilis TaxID=1844116 RepID=UPI001115CC5E|nr:DNA phosphorothioation-dependent restriction protein DptF [Brevibacillus dissolubilis]
MLEEKAPTCLVTILKKCKQSSREAVENIQSFSPFKRYMHVERTVEKELKELIEQAFQSPSSQLILVCGGVGDGKSHILSYFKDKYPDIIQAFYLHNDATESFEPQKTSIQTLAERFKEFSDEMLSSNEVKKALLAINLGTLNNFIDSEEGKAFSRLKKYVEEKKILESVIVDNSFDPDSPFQFINFSDYHMFQLTEDGPKSDYMKKLMQKITEDKPDNPFHEVYRTNCLSNCPAAEQCPVKHNYELLSLEAVQDKVTSVLIQTIVKEKLIISTRGLLNFYHDLLVSPRFESMGDLQIRDEIEKLSFEEYVDQLLPMLLFSKPEISPIMQAVHRQSPTRIRSEELDERYVEFRTKENIYSIFQEHIDLDQLAYLGRKISQSPYEINDERDGKPFKQKLVQLFTILYLLVPKQEHGCYVDIRYDQFMKYLFFWNAKKVTNLRELYGEVRDATYKWDGHVNNSYTNLRIGKAQTQYQTFQELQIKPFIQKDKEITESVLDKFLQSMTLYFKPEKAVLDTEQYPGIELDYSLYSLLSKIREGYRPNKNDKLQFIKFVEFINKLNRFGEQHKELLFEERQGAKKVKYVLQYDESFDRYSFKMEM